MALPEGPQPDEVAAQVTYSGMTLKLLHGDGEFNPGNIRKELDWHFGPGGWRAQVLTKRLDAWHQRDTPVQEGRSAALTLPGGTLQFGVKKGARPMPDDVNRLVSDFMAEVSALFPTPPPE